MKQMLLSWLIVDGGNKTGSGNQAKPVLVQLSSAQPASCFCCEDKMGRLRENEFSSESAV